MFKKIYIHVYPHTHTHTSHIQGKFPWNHSYPLNKRKCAYMRCQTIVTETPMKCWRTICMKHKVIEIDDEQQSNQTTQLKSVFGDTFDSNHENCGNTNRHLPYSVAFLSVLASFLAFSIKVLQRKIFATDYRFFWAVSET